MLKPKPDILAKAKAALKGSRGVSRSSAANGPAGLSSSGSNDQPPLHHNVLSEAHPLHNSQPHHSHKPPHESAESSSEAEAGTLASHSSGGTSGVAAKLKDLKKMKDEELISEAEYDSAKAKLLMELTG